jgi:acyl-coenzyme A thioesterase 9
MNETNVKTALMCHPEERNVYNKIFGGFIMRQALENAWISVRRFACEIPVLIAVDELVFKNPVEVGSMLFLSAYIVYRPPDTTHVVVRVNAEVVNVDAATHREERVVTNTAYFVFDVPNCTTLRNVLPETYADSMLYLDGKRHYEAVRNDKHWPRASGILTRL